MPSDTSSPSAGIYHIRNAASNELLNLVRRQPLDKPTAFTCKVTGSPTQKWELESRPGQPSGSKFRIRNIVADLYLAHNRIAALDSNSDNVLALPDAFNWKLTKIGEGYYISCSQGSIELYLGDSIRHASGAIRQNEHGVIGVVKREAPRKSDPQQSFIWIFEKVTDSGPPPYLRSPFIGPVPPGIYWIGQPDGNASTAVASKAKSVAGITVSARLSLEDSEVAPIHLGYVLKAPWLNQIWLLESGVHGYRIKNLGTETYLTYLKSEPVVQPCTTGTASSSEWRITRVPKKEGDNESRASYTISPLADLNYILTSMLYSDTFNKIGVSPSAPSFFSKSSGYTEWRFEYVDEDWLKYPGFSVRGLGIE